VQFTTGCGITYQPSLLVARPPGDEPDESLPVADIPAAGTVSAAQSTPSLAAHCQPGTRFPSHTVLGQADARPWTLHHKMPSDGRFRLVVFGGDVSDASQRARVNDFGAWVRTALLPRFGTLRPCGGADPHGATLRFRTARAPSLVDVLLVHAAPRDAVEPLRDLDEAYRPFDARLGWEYDKVFVDAPSHHEGDGEAYRRYGVDRARGAVVLVRPDGYVGLVVEVGREAQAEVERWFDGVLTRVP